MKNAKKIVLAMLMAMVMAFALCSCGGANADGTYVVSEADGKNVDEALKVYEKMGQSMTAEQLCTLTINGSKFTLTFLGASVGEGSCEVSGETLKLTVGEQSMTGTIKDGSITLSMGGTNMVLKKK